eukprot:4246606-Pleurochrysis_carterae.AAC.2
MCVCVRVGAHACVILRECVRACARVRACACVRACAWACACACACACVRAFAASGASTKKRKAAVSMAPSSEG